jgi:uncharacterized protein (TIGR02598 family)
MESREHCYKMLHCRYIPPAFSLVEVTLAIGILSFSILVILGLMPAGLTTMRSAMSSTIETQIVRKIGGEMLLIPHSQLPTIAKGGPRYFDDEGQEQPALAYDTCYTLTLELEQSVYPGATNADAKSLEASMSTIQVILDHVAGGTAKAGNKSYYNLTVPNSGN